LTFAVDQVSKSWVVARLEFGQSVDLWSWLAPVLRLTHVTNTGVAFGLLPGMGDFFVIVAVVVVSLLLLYYRHLPPGQVVIRIALGLQLGGALGNLSDRLARGSVVDFVDLNFWPLQKWPVFNLADASIVAGAVLIAVTMVWQEEPESEGEDG
jgi:signal peptidase II